MKKFFTEKEIRNANWVSDIYLYRHRYREVHEIVFEFEDKFYTTCINIIDDNEYDIYDEECEEVKEITEVKTIETVKWIPVDNNLEGNK